MAVVIEHSEENREKERIDRIDRGALGVEAVTQELKCWGCSRA